MTGTKSRGEKRSGVVRRTVTRRTFEQFSEFVASNNKIFAPETFRATAEEFLDHWDEHAFGVYGRHGLPTFHRCWRAGPDQPWRPDSERPVGSVQVGEAYSMAHLIGAEAAEADTEIGFATAILKRTFLARSHLRQTNHPEAWRAFAEAATISQDFQALQLEFGYGPWLGSGRKQARGRTQGALSAALVRRERAKARLVVWLREDAKLSASLSFRARALRLERKFRNTPYAASESTIRRALSKNGA